VYMWFFSFFFFVNSGLTLARQSLYLLSHSASPFFMLGIFKIGSYKLFAQAGLKP
jgi:hypothetical protein